MQGDGVSRVSRVIYYIIIYTNTYIHILHYNLCMNMYTQYSKRDLGFRDSGVIPQNRLLDLVLGGDHHAAEFVLLCFDQLL